MGYEQGQEVMRDSEEAPITAGSREEHTRRELERANAQMRHFRAVAASLVNEALKVWAEIWRVCEDRRTPDEILNGKTEPEDGIPACGWDELRQKLYLLRHYLDYSKRLCDGSI